MPMLKAKYINHQGKEVLFGEGYGGLFLNKHDLFDFDWSIIARGNRIIGVNNAGIREHNLPLVIVAPTKEQACEFANQLFSLCEADLVANQKGRLVVNGYNLKCFIRGQSYTDWSYTEDALKITAKAVRDAKWYKTLETISFNGSNQPQITIIDEADIDTASPSAESATDPWTGGNKGYYYGYPYDYTSTREEFFFNNRYGIPLSWKAIVFGSTSSITFNIGGHTYEVPDVSLATGERLEITAKESLDEKTVFKYNASGERTNLFYKRSTTSYLFEPIHDGNQKIEYASNLVWKLTPIIERSSPEWL